MTLPGNIDPTGIFVGEYQLVVTHPVSGEVIDIVTQDRIEHLKYSRKINDVGIMSLTISINDNLANFISQVDLIFDIYRRNAIDGSLEYEDAYFLQMYDRSQINLQGDEKIIISGKSIDHLLKRRRIFPEDDPLGAGGFSTKDGDAAFVLSQFISNQIVNPFTNSNRRQSQVTLAPLPTISFYDTQQRRNQDDILLAVCQDIVNQVTEPVLDFRLIHTGAAQIRVDIAPRGSDKTVTTRAPLSLDFTLISTRRGNLRNPQLVVDRRDEQNFVLVAGQGIADSRVFVSSTSSRLNDSPFNRKESTIDSKTGNSLEELQDAGAVEIVNQLPIEEIKFEFFPGSAQSVYNVDWIMGDLITAEYADYTEDHRIESVDITIQGANESIEFNSKRIR